jgi:hypothetical protein
MENVYILTNSKGSHSDYKTFIIGVFTDLNQDKAAKKKHLARIKEIRNTYNATEMDKYENEWRDEPDYKRTKECEKYKRWKYGINLINDEVKIRKVPLNETIFNFKIKYGCLWNIIP